MNGKKDGAERERTMDSVVARGVAAYWRVWSMKGAFAMPMESLGCRRGVLRGGDAVRRWAHHHTAIGRPARVRAPRR